MREITKKIMIWGKKVSATAVLGLALGLILTGCGSSKEEAAKSQESTESQLEITEQQGDEETQEAQAAQETDEVLTVRLGVMTGQTQHWMAIIGTEKGFYEKYGLNIEVSEFARGIDTVDAVTNGIIDIGGLADFAFVNRVGTTIDNSELRVFADISVCDVNNFYVNPDKISELSDIAGKVIIDQKGTVTEYWNALTLERAGLTAEDVELVQVENAGVDVLALADQNSADAVWANGETAKRLEENYGWVPILTQPDIEAETYTIAVSTESYIQEHKDVIERFVAANEEVIQYITDNFEEAAELISDSTGMELDVFKTLYEGYIVTQELSQSLYDDLSSIAAWAYENGYYEKEYNVKDYLYTDALTAVDPELVTYQAE